MSKPVGGRGHKVPYDTVVMRVPLPLAAEFRQYINDFHNLVNAGVMSPGQATVDLQKQLGYTPLTSSQALMEARKILRAKKSARESLLKLLQVLYGDILEVDLIERKPE